MRSNGAGIEQIAVRAGDHGVGVLAGADSGASRALMEQGGQLDRPVIARWGAEVDPAALTVMTSIEADLTAIDDNLDRAAAGV
jgi:hypothetical protein